MISQKWLSDISINDESSPDINRLWLPFFKSFPGGCPTH